MVETDFFRTMAGEDNDGRFDMVEVAVSSNQGEAALLKSILNAGEVPYLVQGEEFSIAMGCGTLAAARFLVPRAHFARAAELIAEYNRNRR